MTPTLNLTGLTPTQIQQLQTLAEQFRTANQQRPPQSPTPKLDSDLSFLCFSSEILQPFDRSQLYGNRT